jgi:hypothetical protein
MGGLLFHILINFLEGPLDLHRHPEALKVNPAHFRAVVDKHHVVFCLSNGYP